MTDTPYAEDRVLELPFADGKHTVRVWEAPQPAAVIVAVHGGMAHSGDYATVGDYFRSAGVSTVSFDLTGHGRRARIDIAGFEVFLDDTERMLRWTQTTWTGVPVFLMGHSMGALIATHMELSGRLDAYAIRGIMLSSPYYANAIPVSPLVVRLSRILAALFPTAKVPMASLNDWLTHDLAIKRRHEQDEIMQRRASEVSLRFGRSLLEAQSALNGDLSRWRHPVYAVIAGDDKLADARISVQMLHTVPEALRTLSQFPQNFHENFNELNRNDIFADLWPWMRKYCEPSQ